jgi:hypothetical protein
MRSIAWCIALWLVVLTGHVRAEEESEKVRRARLENELEKEADRTDQACGTKLTVKIEWEGFSGEAWERKSVSGYCEAPLGALRHYCQGPAAKAYIAKNVRAFVCKAAKGKDDWKIRLEGGTLEWDVPPDSVNADAYAREQVLRHL